LGDFAVDTAVSGADGRYTATLSPEWEIWGPNGGYVATIALRAAGAESRFTRPATFTGQFLSVARFEPVELHVELLRSTKTAEALRVSMTQGDRTILEAHVWTVGDIDGLTHDDAPMPSVAPPRDVLSREERMRDLPPPPVTYRFWENLDDRPIDWIANWQDREPSEPSYRAWMQYRPRATFDDPFVDAGRSLLLVDTMGWPAAVRAHREPIGFIAPNIDVATHFHRLQPDSEWLFIETTAPVAADGLIGFGSRVWSETGALLASGGGQLLCRPATTSPAG
jgi:acyl-CoA thioesterase